MGTWGKTDNAANSVLWATTQVNLPANSTNRTALFGNTTASGFKNNNVAMNKTVGQFGLDVTEIGVSNASVVAYETTFAGSGYSANAVVTVTGNATANGLNTGGRISVLLVAGGNTYTTKPTVTVAAPTAVAFNANTAVTDATDAIAITTANSIFLANDRVTYTVAAGNTALTNLTSGAQYFIKTSNTTAVTLSATQGGDTINLTKGLTEAGHSLTGQTATAVATISGVPTGAAHSGWVLRTVGQGGRAGRVTYETLVAMGSMTGDAEDTILKDS